MKKFLNNWLPWRLRTRLKNQEEVTENLKAYYLRVLMDIDLYSAACANEVGCIKAELMSVNERLDWLKNKAKEAPRTKLNLKPEHFLGQGPIKPSS